jgi:hypothetical protein
MRWSSSLVRRLASMIGNRPNPNIRQITRLVVTAVVICNLAGAGSILAIGLAHASHPDVPIIQLH